MCSYIEKFIIKLNDYKIYFLCTNMFNLNIIIALILLDMIHNNIQIHNNVLWDRQYFTKYSLIFCTFSIKVHQVLQTFTLNTKYWVYKHDSLPYHVTFLNNKILLCTKHHALPHLARIYLTLVNKRSRIFSFPNV